MGKTDPSANRLSPQRETVTTLINRYFDQPSIEQVRAALVRLGTPEAIEESQKLRAPNAPMIV